MKSVRTATTTQRSFCQSFLIIARSLLSLSESNIDRSILIQKKLVALFCGSRVKSKLKPADMNSSLSAGAKTRFGLRLAVSYQPAIFHANLIARLNFIAVVLPRIFGRFCRRRSDEFYRLEE